MEMENFKKWRRKTPKKDESYDEWKERLYKQASKIKRREECDIYCDICYGENERVEFQEDRNEPHYKDMVGQ